MDYYELKAELDKYIDLLKRETPAELLKRVNGKGDVRTVKDGRVIILLAATKNIADNTIAVLAGAQYLVFPFTPPPEYDSFIKDSSAIINEINDVRLYKYLYEKIGPHFSGCHELPK